MAQPGGIYIHIPFCFKRCGYCSFHSCTDLTYMDGYVEALLREIDLRSKSLPDGFVADTLYFGGGTPSLLEYRHLKHIMAKVRERLPLLAGAEITLEANPATIGRGDFDGLLELGVNRLSIGMQTFNDDMLHLLGRLHKAEDSVRTFGEARAAGFDNISLDLIYGLPGQTEADLAYDLAVALSLNSEHISAYMLTLELDGNYSWAAKDGTKVKPVLSEDFQRYAFDATRRRLEAAGYNQYEISNFNRADAVRDLRSRHNLKYWNGASYLGLGLSAHGFWAPNVRTWNVFDMQYYIDRLRRGDSPVEESETLTTEQRLIELIYLGLRQRSGIDLAAFRALAGYDFAEATERVLHELRETGLVMLTNSHCLLTEEGLAYQDYATGRLVEEL